MRIACPNCATEYDVPDRLLTGSTRTLRCSRCATEFALPQAEPPAPPAAATQEPPPVDATAPSPPPATVPLAVAPPTPLLHDRIEAAMAAESSRALKVAWAVSLAIIAGGMVGLWVFRAELTAAWPPAARLFNALGLA